MNTNLKNLQWGKYLFEFLSIFIGVSFAFAMNKWNEDRRDYQSEEKTLLEIRNGLELDLDDIAVNISGHNEGIDACKFMRKLVNNENVKKDSIIYSYFVLTRDFVSIQNNSGYESLKSRGLQLVRNDSLRLGIVTLYDFYYETLEKLEENYAEIQFHNSFFHQINDMLAPFMVFNEKGKLIGIKQPISLSAIDKNRILSYFWKIEINRKFMISHYSDVEAKIKSLIKQLDGEVE